jgi:hypothetical protein
MFKKNKKESIEKNNGCIYMIKEKTNEVVPKFTLQAKEQK